MTLDIEHAHKAVKESTLCTPGSEVEAPHRQQGLRQRAGFATSGSNVFAIAEVLHICPGLFTPCICMRSLETWVSIPFEQLPLSAACVLWLR